MAQIEAKSLVIAEIREKIEKSQSWILADYRGITVKEATKLRNKLRAAGVEFKVVKNTLTRRAANELGITGLDNHLEGPTAIAFGMTDPAAPAKILTEFIKEAKKLTIKAGVIDGKVIDPEGVKALAELPSREVLLAQVLGAMQGPLVGLANVLQGPIRKFGYALEDLRKQKEAAGA